MGVKDFFCVYVLWINCRIEDGCLWIVKGVLDVKGGYKHPVNTSGLATGLINECAWQ